MPNSTDLKLSQGHCAPIYVPGVQSAALPCRECADWGNAVSQPAKLVNAVPVLASLDIAATVKFYVSKLSFKEVHAEAGSWGIVERDAIQIHFWHCNDRCFPENTSCRIQVEKIDVLHAELQPQGVMHPNGPLRNTEWGTREFDVLDLYGNLLTFFEKRAA